MPFQRSPGKRNRHSGENEHEFFSESNPNGLNRENVSHVCHFNENAEFQGEDGADYSNAKEIKLNKETLKRMPQQEEILGITDYSIPASIPGDRDIYGLETDEDNEKRSCCSSFSSSFSSMFGACKRCCSSDPEKESCIHKIKKFILNNLFWVLLLLIVPVLLIFSSKYSYIITTLKGSENDTYHRPLMEYIKNLLSRFRNTNDVTIPMDENLDLCGKLTGNNLDCIVNAVVNKINKEHLIKGSDDNSLTNIKGITEDEVRNIFTGMHNNFEHSSPINFTSIDFKNLKDDVANIFKNLTAITSEVNTKLVEGWETKLANMSADDLKHMIEEEMNAKLDKLKEVGTSIPTETCKELSTNSISDSFEKLVNSIKEELESKRREIKDIFNNTSTYMNQQKENITSLYVQASEIFEKIKRIDNTTPCDPCPVMNCTDHIIPRSEDNYLDYIMYRSSSHKVNLLSMNMGANQIYINGLLLKQRDKKMLKLFNNQIVEGDTVKIPYISTSIINNEPAKKVITIEVTLGKGYYYNENDILNNTKQWNGVNPEIFEIINMNYEGTNSNATIGAPGSFYVYDVTNYQPNVLPLPSDATVLFNGTYNIKSNDKQEFSMNKNIKLDKGVERILIVFDVPEDWKMLQLFRIGLYGDEFKREDNQDNQ